MNKDMIRELSNDELNLVEGGLNPQPLPPRVAFFELFTASRLDVSNLRLLPPSPC
jgi:bacteriocin-like protein